MKICENCPEANSVHVEPFNIEDWEIMVSNTLSVCYLIV